MGVRDVSGHGMTDDQRFDLTEAPFVSYGN